MSSQYDFHGRRHAMLWWTLDLLECRGLAGAIADRAEACFVEASEVTYVRRGGLGGPRCTRFG